MTRIPMNAMRDNWQRQRMRLVKHVVTVLTCVMLVIMIISLNDAGAPAESSEPPAMSMLAHVEEETNELMQGIAILWNPPAATGAPCVTLGYGGDALK